MKALVMNCNEFNKSLNITITINLVRTEGLTSTSQAKSMIQKVANEIENLFLDHALGIPEFNSTLECTMPKLKEDDEGSPELPIAHSLISVQCDPGYKTVSNDGCITCPRGTYWEGDNCYYCPSGSYQEFSAQTMVSWHIYVVELLHGGLGRNWRFGLQNGSKFVFLCSKRFFGEV